MSSKSEKRERFERLVPKRTNKIIERLDILENCANRNMYEYEKEDVKKIFKAIRNKMKKVESSFEFPEEDEFEL